MRLAEVGADAVVAEVGAGLQALGVLGLDSFALDVAACHGQAILAPLRQVVGVGRGAVLRASRADLGPIGGLGL